MLSRSKAILLATVLVVLYAIAPAFAHDKAEGAVVKAGEGKLTMAAAGKDKEHKQHTLDVAKDAPVTLDGKPAKLEDLKEGFHVVVALGEKHLVTKIEAHSKHK